MTMQMPGDQSQVAIRIDLGPHSAFKEITRTLDDLSRVIETVTKLMKKNDLKTLVAKHGMHLSRSEENRVRHELNESKEYTVRVQKLDYSNPIHITLINLSPTVIFLLNPEILRVICD